MRFSIVTANYNYGHFLPECLQSVLSQVGENVEIEHIVVDGVSKDDSISILKSWEKGHKGISGYTFHWSCEPDNGQTDAINKGLRKATGDVVAWLNADEYYLPGKLSIMAQAFEKHTQSDFIYGESLYVNQEGTPLRIKRDHVFSRFVLLYYGCVIPSCASFWRRKVLDDGHFLDISFKVTMDREYWCRLTRNGYHFRFIPTTVAAFIWHDHNASLVLQENLHRDSEEVIRRFTPMSRPLLCFLHELAYTWRRILVVVRMMFLHMETIPEAVQGPTK